VGSAWRHINSTSALGGQLDQLDDSLRLRDLDGVTAPHLEDRRARALGHLTLRRQLHHDRKCTPAPSVTSVTSLSGGKVGV
jgi:hypothetical protein